MDTHLLEHFVILLVLNRLILFLQLTRCWIDCIESFFFDMSSDSLLFSVDANSNGRAGWIYLILFLLVPPTLLYTSLTNALNR